MENSTLQQINELEWQLHNRKKLLLSHNEKIVIKTKIKLLEDKIRN